MLIAVEIGGTKLQIANGRKNGSIDQIIRGRVNPMEGRKGILSWIEQNLHSLIAQSEEKGIKYDAIGVGFGGPIETASGNIFQSVQIEGWSGFNLKEWFEKKFSIPTFVFNDSSAAGWGEYKLGTGRGTNQFFYTNIGSGIGGSLIINGTVADVEAAVKDVLNVLENTLHFAPTVITKS